eukprot:6651314-Prymnesium_polylepis.1
MRSYDAKASSYSLVSRAALPPRRPTRWSGWKRTAALSQAWRRAAGSASSAQPSRCASSSISICRTSRVSSSG